MSAPDDPADEHFTDQLERVVAEVQRVLERTQAVRNLRTRQGRRLSAETRARLASLEDELGRLIAECQGIVAAPGSPEELRAIQTAVLRALGGRLEVH